MQYSKIWFVVFKGMVGSIYSLGVQYLASFIRTDLIEVDDLFHSYAEMRV